MKRTLSEIKNEAKNIEPLPENLVEIIEKCGSEHLTDYKSYSQLYIKNYLQGKIQSIKSEIELSSKELEVLKKENKLSLNN